MGINGDHWGLMKDLKYSLIPINLHQSALIPINHKLVEINITVRLNCRNFSTRTKWELEGINGKALGIINFLLSWVIDVD